MITYQDPNYHYRVAFNPDTGVYVRTSILDEDLKQTTLEPFRGSYPHLLDVGIMGHCLHGISGKCGASGVQCYQSGNIKQEPHMSFENFKKLIDESENQTFQIALGGRGDPDQHPDFLKMIRYAKEHNIVPNFTTSGYGLDFKILPEVKKYCGAVAVSYYRNYYTSRAIEALLAHGIKTNIHFVLGNNTIDEAIDWIENKKIPSGINRVIFLLHKPVGNGEQSNVLSFDDPKVKYFYSLFNQEENCLMAGFDTCTAPALIHFADKIAKSSYDTCEGGRFSAYVTPDFKLLPCSFDGRQKYAVDLTKYSVKEAFNSITFDQFREKFVQTIDRSNEYSTCLNCKHQELCMGGCPLMKEIVLCHDIQRIDPTKEVRL
ncbi:MAG: radical SAM protein [Clostridia bacterium]|nr:radical SAM protein [Clostridia bacterium]